MTMPNDSRPADAPPGPGFARLAGLGAMAAAGGLVLVFLAFVVFTRPSPSGLDAQHRAIAWIGVGGIIAALVAVHVVLGRRLMDLARGVRRMP